MQQSCWKELYHRNSITLCKLLQQQVAQEINSLMATLNYELCLLYCLVFWDCRNRNWGTKGKTDQVHKVYNWRSKRTNKTFIHDLFPQSGGILLFFSWKLEFLAINQGSSERRDIFVPRLLKLSYILVVLHLAWTWTSPQWSWIMQSSLAPFPGCQGLCGIVPNGHANLVVSLIYVRAWSF